MVRYILAIVVGYAVLAIIVVAGFSVAFVAPQLAFQPYSLDVTNNFLVYTLVLSIFAALAGGYVCKAISKCHKVVMLFAVIAMAVGIGSAISNQRKEPANISAEQLASMPMMERGQYARQPNWYAWTLPFIALAGIILGGKLRK